MKKDRKDKFGFYISEDGHQFHPSWNDGMPINEFVSKQTAEDKKNIKKAEALDKAIAILVEMGQKELAYQVRIQADSLLGP